MPPSVTTDLAGRLAAECASLPPEKQSTVLDFVLFVKHQLEESPGDAGWERILSDPRPRPKLDAYLESIAGESSVLMDENRL
jgi:hypothetical protein